ncbi:uncharacterized protein PAC_09867 [Phialocephala subalpina]|uniref:Uncharacterized protein n=1 Tax=Phialocephala subalpina TaxID=576137 RepID=A0A1L7X4N6_9HELO|nr:uncharacterized protein PAC_09867 [Phialocephala subalpina]
MAQSTGQPAMSASSSAVAAPASRSRAPIHSSQPQFNPSQPMGPGNWPKPKNLFLNADKIAEYKPLYDWFEFLRQVSRSVPGWKSDTDVSEGRCVLIIPTYNEHLSAARLGERMKMKVGSRSLSSQASRKKGMMLDILKEHRRKKQFADNVAKLLEDDSKEEDGGEDAGTNWIISSSLVITAEL